ncbi:CMRF35-like molecule 7 isoform X3 [Diceros bicornis minor]|uniref:CMRF35-like molecule 7 isoform X3 n=1 Tax=Diceros bicornis minor TaxID=77932 RepID=UPI0026F0493C|nr:CMRF35-like molecule 7 isoform X3 [Diceros bicornis minor]
MEERVDVRGQLGGSREDWGPWSSPWTSVWGHVSRGLPGQGGSQGRSCILRFCFPGCFSIQGPESVRGPEKGSVTVQCHYKPGWEIYRKWWCRGARDDQRDRVLTVTMEELRRDDAGTYWCGIERTGVDLGTRVKVAIDPEGTVLSTPASPPTANNHTGVSSGTSVSPHQKTTGSAELFSISTSCPFNCQQKWVPRGDKTAVSTHKASGATEQESELAIWSWHWREQPGGSKHCLS